MESPPTQADGTEDPLPRPPPGPVGHGVVGADVEPETVVLAGWMQLLLSQAGLINKQPDRSPFWNTLIFYEGLSAQESTERREAGGGVNGQWLPQAQRGEARGADGGAGGGDPAWGSLNTDPQNGSQKIK